MRMHYEVHDSSGLYGRYKLYIDALLNAYALSINDDYIVVKRVTIEEMPWRLDFNPDEGV